MVAVSTVDVCRFRLRTALHCPLLKSLLRPESADSGRKIFFRTRTVPGDQSLRPVHDASDKIVSYCLNHQFQIISKLRSLSIWAQPV